MVIFSFSRDCRFLFITFTLEFMKKLTVLLMTLFWLQPFFIAHGHELYRLVRQDCGSETGFIINTDSDNVYLLSVTGELKVFTGKELRHILIYNTLDNPIPSLKEESGLQEYLRNIQVEEYDLSGFVGWPIKFIEESVVFFDIEGKTHIIDVDRLLKIERTVDLILTEQTIKAHEPVNFVLGDTLYECRKADEDEGGGGVRPTRIISDKIKIHKFLSNYQRGFERLRRFQFITNFYPKPFLYDRTTKVGLVLNNRGEQEYSNGLPFYFQMSSGRPFALQSFTSVGTVPIELLPNIEPIFAVRADFKSHFFHANFAGNLLGLSAGSRVVTADGKGMYEDFFDKMDNKSAAMATHFNYMAMTGIDWHEYSFSGGTWYPVYTFHGKSLFREILATQSSPVFRFQYTLPKFHASLIYSKTKMEKSDPTESDLVVKYSSDLSSGVSLSPQSETLLSKLTQFSLDAWYIRLSGSYQIEKGLKVGLDEVIHSGKYDETFSGKENQINSLQMNTSVWLTQRFSSYVNIKLHINYFHRTYDYDFNKDEKSELDNDYTVGGAIEFLL